MVTVCTVGETSNEGHIVAGLDSAIYATMHRSVHFAALSSNDPTDARAQRLSSTSIQHVQLLANSVLNTHTAALYLKRRSQLWWALLFNESETAASLVRELSLIVSDAEREVLHAVHELETAPPRPMQVSTSASRILSNSSAVMSSPTALMIKRTTVSGTKEQKEHIEALKKKIEDFKKSYSRDMQSIIDWSLTDRMVDGNVPRIVCPEVCCREWAEIDHFRIQ